MPTEEILRRLEMLASRVARGVLTEEDVITEINCLIKEINAGSY